MPHDLGSRVFLAVLLLITAALSVGLVRYGPWLADEVKAGVSMSKKSAPVAPTVMFDALSGVTVEVPDKVTPMLCGLGVILKRDSDAMKAAVVCPMIADKSIAPSEVLTAIHAVWASGMKESNETLTLGLLHDEGKMVHASIDSGHGLDAMSGELRVYRAPPGLRVEAFWTPKDEFDRERAAMEALTRTVHLQPGQPLPMHYGRRHVAGVPEGFQITEDEGGIEVTSKQDERLAFGLATGTGHAGFKKAEDLIEHYLTKSRGLTDPTTGLTRAYPLIHAPEGQRWDITARECEYSTDERRVHAVLTAALTSGTAGDAFILSVRQSPPEDWGRHGFTLAAIEASAAYYPQGLDHPSLVLPLSHPENTWELLEGWALGRAVRKYQTVRWREALLPADRRASMTMRKEWIFPPWLAQPDGTYLNPENPLEVLVPSLH